jgi:hypothetical protein
MADFMTGLKAVCLLSGLAMHLAPLSTMREIEQARSTLSFHVVPYAGPLLNHLVNLWYAVIRADGPLIVHRVIGIAAQLHYIRTFLRFLPPGGAKALATRRWLQRVALALAAIAVELHVVLPLVLPGPAAYGAHIAFFAFVTGVGLAASPLATVGEVLRTRDASSLPTHLCAMVTLQCFSWMVYGWLRDDLSTFANNLIGVALGASQLALICFFGQAGSRGRAGAAEGRAESSANWASSRSRPSA